MSTSFATRRVRLNNARGLHLRSALALSQQAQRFSCVIQVSCGDRHADAKSILDLVALVAEGGSELIFEARGADSTAAVESLVQLVQSQFRDLQPVKLDPVVAPEA